MKIEIVKTINKTVFLFFLLFSLPAFSNGPAKQLAGMLALDFRNRLEIRGYTFITDLNGALLSDGTNSAVWSFLNNKGPEIEASWSLRLAYRLSAADESKSNQVKVMAYLQLFTNKKNHPEALLKNEKMEINDFSPITFEVDSQRNQRLWVRLIPSLKPQPFTRDIGNLPLMLNDILLFDSNGDIWTHGGSVSSDNVVIKTSRGSVAISFRPFKHANEIGVARGHEIIINANNKNFKIPILHLRSSTAIAPEIDFVKIYGLVETKQKIQEKDQGTRFMGFSDKDDVLKIIEN